MTICMRTALTVLSVSLCLLIFPAPLFAQQQATSNAFNPAISLILDGRYGLFSNDPEDYRLPGFQLGGESGPGTESFNLGESELLASANIDDRFYGTFTAALHSENGETHVELEEAYLETIGLGHGFTIRAGRFFSQLGYLNNIHLHAQDFVDLPLVYRAMFGGQFNEDGVQIRWLAPTLTFIELGLEIGGGNDFPTSRGSGSIGSAVGTLTFGGDIGVSHSWQFGLSYLHASVNDRTGGIHPEDNPVESSFTGDDHIPGIDLVYKWAPRGNATERNFKFQAEYFHRNEDGAITLVDAPGISTLDGRQSGWYAQGVYQFIRRWRVGLRYDQLDADNDGSNPTALAAGGFGDQGYTPRRYSAMVDYSYSEFSRFRLQYNHDESYPDTDDEIFAQFIVSLGAHRAHTF
ncbi:MAG TPA: hypothetical protein VHJ19_07710 [Gammaproteobacteria bacterium]|nr:hypothetical protein [Gammaproteobacteria bacterium]